MRLKLLLNRVLRYGVVGGTAAAVHLGVLLLLGQWISLSLANPIAFLAASIAGYLGHALLTFREETGGKQFARRWLLLQYVVNISVCALLPLLKASTLVLVFTPTVLNALIWSQAARFSLRRRVDTVIPLRHADDLGLSPATNEAILRLAASGQLDGTSVLVNGPVAAEGVTAWTALVAAQPHLQLVLHLCLTEGPCCAPPELVPDLVNARGHLRRSFGQWLLLSLWPPRHPSRRRLERQLGLEVEAQIRQFRRLCGHGPIHLDGHQHIHLVPVVLDAVLKRATTQQITWLRRTDEPLPTGLPISDWWRAIRDAGLLKWVVLQWLSRRAHPAMRRHGIVSNQSFAGVLFTGHMAGAPLRAAWSTLRSTSNDGSGTPPLLLAHPAAPLDTDLAQAGFAVSAPFAASPWRQREWQALQAL
ncbi:MAG: ChbG/HpnK family deacetylase [Cyanobacteriota bacterium]|nr:ChbG/HpnK family deacetylase [Cyanobacteriota bacterium]